MYQFTQILESIGLQDREAGLEVHSHELWSEYRSQCSPNCSVIIKELCLQGIKILEYLDDWILWAPSPLLCCQAFQEGQG